jgi:DNA-cytosine methyltransferase
MNVLSLFDGISCAYEALLKAKKPIGTYYASEIDKNAIKVSTQNHPDIVRLGDVREITAVNLPAIDLLIGGSPCQDLSIAKKDRKGLEGDRSSLFWDYVRLKNELNPKYFILENVASMPQKDKDIITEALGVQPVLFNASLVSAQSRKRLFWTNIKFDLPEDKGIVLKDILQPADEVSDTMIVKDKKVHLKEPKGGPTGISYAGHIEANIRKGFEDQEHLSRAHRQQNRVYGVEGKSPSLVATETSGRTHILATANGLLKVGHIGTTNSQGNRVYDPKGKSVCLSANGGGLGAKTGLYQIGHIGTTNSQTNRVYSPEGKAPTQCKGPSGGALPTLIKIGRDVGRRLNDEGHREDNNKELPITRRIELRTDDKVGTITSVQKDNLVVSETKIRKLTPIECERLMGLPDNYTQSVAMTNRYKCVGNAFHVDVVAHILEAIT